MDDSYDSEIVNKCITQFDEIGVVVVSEKYVSDVKDVLDHRDINYWAYPSQLFDGDFWFINRPIPEWENLRHV